MKGHAGKLHIIRYEDLIKQHKQTTEGTILKRL